MLTGKFEENRATVAEMSTDAQDSADLGINIPFDAQLRDELIEGDDNPMFVTVEVLNEGVSRNGRDWTKEAIASVVSQINSKHPDGYQGHLSDTDRSTKYPDPQTIWLGASAKEVGGKLRLFAKGYVLPEAKTLRSYLRKAKTLKKNVAVSVYGTVQAAVKTARNALDMSNFNLESIDWARPGSEGVPNMGIFQVTSEMFDSNNNGEGNMDKVQAIKESTAAELREHNPAVVSEMVSEAVAEATQASEAVVSEMTQTREALGLKEGESLTERVAEMQEQLSEAALDNSMREKIPSATARKTLRSAVVKEMNANADLTADAAVDAVLGSEKGKAVMRNTAERAPSVAPLHDAPTATPTRRFSKRVG